MPKRVLIIYATGGMGHVKAAAAVEQAFNNKYPDVEIKNVDVIDYAATIYRKVFVDGYNYVSAKYPDTWGWLYRGFNKKSRQKLPTMISQLAIEGNFIPFVKKFNPDFIVSTHPLPMMMISASKRKEVINIDSSMVLTDFGCHSFWIDSWVNYYFVATEEVKKCLQGYKVKSENIAVTGIPIELKFAKELNRQEIIKKLGLNPKIPTLLIVGGQFEFASLQKIIAGIKQVHKQNVQFLVVAGRDKELNDALAASDLKKDLQIKIFGFVNNMEELMTAADLIFSKAGGLTVSECLAKGLPMVINKVIPGQEEDNLDYLVKNEAAIRATTFDEIIEQVNRLLGDPQKIASMKGNCLKLGRPHSAEALADFVYNKINEKK